MSFAVPPGCGSEIFAAGCAGCSDTRVAKRSVCTGGTGFAATGSGGNGFGADSMPDDSCFAFASPITRRASSAGAVATAGGWLDSRVGKLSVFAGGLGFARTGFGGDASGAAGAVAGCRVASATGGGAAGRGGADAMLNESCFALASPKVRSGDASGATGAGTVAGAPCSPLTRVRSSLERGE
jgi:hypothetical protein